MKEIVWFGVESADGHNRFIKVPIVDPSQILGTLFATCLAEGIKPTDYRMLGAPETCILTSSIGNLTTA